MFPSHDPMSLSFTVVAESKPELLHMYSKLNFLASSLAPDYTQLGFPRGNIAKLTLGDYLNETPCIITSLNFEIPQDSPFEIALMPDGSVDKSVGQLPLMIKVTMAITPIHDFLPRRIINPGQTDAPFISLQKGKLYPKYGSKATVGSPTAEIDALRFAQAYPPEDPNRYYDEIIEVSAESVEDFIISDDDMNRIQADAFGADDVNFDADGNLILEEEE